jgi:hypothetical protein
MGNSESQLCLALVYGYKAWNYSIYFVTMRDTQPKVLLLLQRNQVLYEIPE